MNDIGYLEQEKPKSFVDVSAIINSNPSFKQSDEKILFNDKPVISFFGDNGAIMAQQPRERFTVKDHITFDEILDLLRDRGRAVTRVVNMADFFDVERQLERLATLPPETIREFSTAFKIGLSEDDIATIRGIPTLRDKMVKAFGSSIAAVSVEYVLTDNKLRPELYVLEFFEKKVAWRNGYEMTTVRLKKYFDKVRPYWQGETDTAPKTESWQKSGYYGNNYYQVKFLEDGIEINGKMLVRSEVERAALNYNWI